MPEAPFTLERRPTVAVEEEAVAIVAAEVEAAVAGATLGMANLCFVCSVVSKEGGARCIAPEDMPEKEEEVEAEEALLAKAGGGACLLLPVPPPPTEGPALAAAAETSAPPDDAARSKD